MAKETPKVKKHVVVLAPELYGKLRDLAKSTETVKKTKNATITTARMETVRQTIERLANEAAI